MAAPEAAVAASPGGGVTSSPRRAHFPGDSRGSSEERVPESETWQEWERKISGEDPQNIRRSNSRDTEGSHHIKIPENFSFARAESEFSEMPHERSGLLVKGFILGIVLVVFPIMCRFGKMSAAGRCGAVIAAMLFINLWEVMQLYCTALFIPVLGTLYGVLGEQKSIMDTSTLLVSKIFNSTSFMVLGALAINGIFTKCGLDRRFMALLLNNFIVNGAPFLLALMLGGTLMCSVLYSGSLVLLVALAPVLKEGLRTGVISPFDSKRILLGVAFCSNAGSALLPISSPVNLITVSLLDEVDKEITINAWVTIAFPVMMLIMIITWAALLIIYPSTAGRIPLAEAWEKQLKMLPRDHIKLTDYHITFMGVGILAVLGITVYATKLEPIIGHSAILSLGVVIIVFGSGFMTKEEFNNLDWDILALVGGSNVMAFLVRETGLGMELSDALMSLDAVETMPYSWLLLIGLALTVFVSGLLAHSITGVLWMPLTIALGIKLEAVEETSILIAIAIPCGMHFAHSSFDNVLSQNASKELGRRSAELRPADFRNAGLVPAVSVVIINTTLGRWIARYFYLAPGTAHRKHIPDELRPSIAKENDSRRRMNRYDEQLLHHQTNSQGASAKSVDPWRFEVSLAEKMSWLTSKGRTPPRSEARAARRSTRLRAKAQQHEQHEQKLSPEE